MQLPSYRLTARNKYLGEKVTADFQLRSALRYLAQDDSRYFADDCDVAVRWLVN